MSSIRPDKLSDDNPSAAFVQSVGTDSATIVQKMPLGFDNNARYGWCLTAAQASRRTYLSGINRPVKS